MPTSRLFSSLLLQWCLMSIKSALLHSQLDWVAAPKLICLPAVVLQCYVIKSGAQRPPEIFQLITAAMVSDVH